MRILTDASVKLPYCYVITTGRVTGEPHEIEIWFAVDAPSDRVYLLSGGADRSDWVKNLIANPSVRLRIGDRTWDARAAVVTDGEQDGRARRLLATKYQAWREGRPMSEWARTALPIAIDLID